MVPISIIFCVVVVGAAYIFHYKVGQWQEVNDSGFILGLKPQHLNRTNSFWEPKMKTDTIKSNTNIRSPSSRSVNQIIEQVTLRKRVIDTLEDVANEPEEKRSSMTDQIKGLTKPAAVYPADNLAFEVSEESSEIILPKIKTETSK